MLSYRATRSKKSKISKMTIILTIIAAIAISITAQISNVSFEYSTFLGSGETATGGLK